jgi:hypothetical protein
VKLEGTIPLFPLDELIEMVVYSSVTGVLNIYGPGAPGALYFRDGGLYHVERTPAVGIVALAELLELAQASFAFVSDVTSEVETLWGGLSQHLQSAERLASRWRPLRAYVPNLELVPQLIVTHDAAARRSGPAHHAVLQAINGQASLRQMAEGLGWAEIDVVEAIVQMSVDGLIELRSVRQQATASVALDLPVRAEGGIFDRMLARGASGLRSADSEPDQPRLAPADQHSQDDLILQMLRS